MFSTEIKALVLDPGALNFKFGYAGEDCPKALMESVVSCLPAMEEEGKDSVRRIEANPALLGLGRSDIQVRQVYQNGSINMDNFKALTKQIYHSLGVDSSEYSLVLAQPVGLLRSTRQRLVHFFFEEMDIKNLYFCKAPVLSCFATGHKTALVIDAGAYTTNITAVHQGFALHKSRKRKEVGGQTLTEQVLQSLRARTGQPRVGCKGSGSQSLERYNQLSFAREVKQSLNSSKESSYVLPDGSTFALDRQNFANIYLEATSSQDTLQHSLIELIFENDTDIKRELMSNIILTGGNSFLYSLSSKLSQKLTELAPPNLKVKLLSFPMQSERLFSQWIGGSILGCLTSFQSMWVGQHEFQEQGYAIFQKKCP